MTKLKPQTAAQFTSNHGRLQQGSASALNAQSCAGRSLWNAGMPVPLPSKDAVVKRPWPRPRGLAIPFSEDGGALVVNRHHPAEKARLDTILLLSPV